MIFECSSSRRTVSVEDVTNIGNGLVFGLRDVNVTRHVIKHPTLSTAITTTTHNNNKSDTGHIGSHKLTTTTTTTKKKKIVLGVSSFIFLFLGFVF